ncbi:hypothetical protein [Glaciecola sp. 1036]|uniref:hypothetical protein n=1 Tax=Alteromonadaceae TaxID=72275 RepID=UPI003D07E743
MLVPIEELESRWLEMENPMALLPLLEYSYPEVLDNIKTSKVLSSELLEQVVEYSLRFPSRHWALSAVLWIENGFVINSDIYDGLIRISKDKTDSQRLRHKAFAQANRWKRGVGIK